MKTKEQLKIELKQMLEAYIKMEIQDMITKISYDILNAQQNSHMEPPYKKQNFAENQQDGSSRKKEQKTSKEVFGLKTPAAKKKTTIKKLPEKNYYIKKAPKFTEEIIQYIKDNWKKKTDKMLSKSIKEEFNIKVSDNTIKKKRHKLGLIKSERLTKKQKKKLHYELADMKFDDENLEEA